MDDGSDAASTEKQSSGGETRSDVVREIVSVGVVAYLLVLSLTLGAGILPWLSQYLYLLVAGVFFYLPFWWIDRNDWSFRRFGLTTENFWRDVGWGLGFAALTAVPFAGGYWVWQTRVLGATSAFDWENYKRWQPELEGAPSDWGREPGVWIWTEDRTVQIGLRSAGSKRVPWTLQLSADRRFSVRQHGDARLEPVERGEPRTGSGANDRRAASTWRIEMTSPDERVKLAVTPEEAGTSRFPESLRVRSKAPATVYPLRFGPAEQSVEGPTFSVERGYRWLYLWLMTQFVFIALPEEYFYRGYLQTRVGDALASNTSGQSDSTDRASGWFGVTPRNLIASAAFGVGHLLTPVQGRILWNRIGVVFPSVVFGWLRDRTGSIVAPVVYHASCNMMVLLAEPHFF